MAMKKAIVADLTPASMGMRLPFSYQSRLFSLPSPNTFFGALLRAAYLVGKNEMYEVAAHTVSYITFRLVNPLSVASVLLVRVRMGRETGKKEKKRRKPTNVFPDTYALPSGMPAFRAVFVLKNNAAEEAMRAVKKAAASISLLGDSDSPTNSSSIKECDLSVVKKDEVETGYAYPTEIGELKEGDAMIAELPILGYAGKGVTMKRTFKKIVVPARQSGNIIFPAIVKVSIENKKGEIFRLVCKAGGSSFSEFLVLPLDSYIDEIRRKVGLP